MLSWRHVVKMLLAFVSVFYFTIILQIITVTVHMHCLVIFALLMKLTIALECLENWFHSDELHVDWS